jgi:hypothetical protein
LYCWAVLPASACKRKNSSLSVAGIDAGGGWMFAGGASECNTGWSEVDLWSQLNKSSDVIAKTLDKNNRVLGCLICKGINVSWLFYGAGKLSDPAKK